MPIQRAGLLSLVLALLLAYAALREARADEWSKHQASVLVQWSDYQQRETDRWKAVRKRVSRKWGREAELPSQKVFVDYFAQDQLRIRLDYEKGELRAESLDGSVAQDPQRIAERVQRPP